MLLGALCNSYSKGSKYISSTINKCRQVFEFANYFLACEHAKKSHHFGELREVMREQHMKGDASVRGGARKGELMA